MRTQTIPDTSPTALARLRDEAELYAKDFEAFLERAGPDFPKQRVIGLLREASAAILALESELAAVKSDSCVTLGVGDGSGQLFVRGTYESIVAARAFIDRATAAEARLLEIAEITEMQSKMTDASADKGKSLAASYVRGKALDRIAAIARSKPAEGERKP